MQHWSNLYVNYLQIYRSLVECYDNMCHPQKRVDVKVTLELVMCRMLELKHLLVKWNPPHASLCAPGCEAPFPWDYVNLDNLLVDVKLSPGTLEVAVPKYFALEHREKQDARNKLIKALQAMKCPERGEDLEVVESSRKTQEQPLVKLTVHEAIEVIQRNERGRQGMYRVTLMKLLKEDAEEKSQKTKRVGMAALKSEEMDPSYAACHIQRLFRGYRSRAAALAEKDAELVFLGMIKSSKHGPGKGLYERRISMKEKLKEAAERRHVEQKLNEETYSSSLIQIHETLIDEEGPEAKEEMMNERRAWFTDELSKGAFPEDMSGFYASKNPPGGEQKDEEGGDGKKGKKGKKEDGKKGGKDKKGGDGESKEEQLPQLTGPTDYTKALQECLKRYEDLWQSRDESDNVRQQHDTEMAKTLVRPNVMEEVRENVDKTLVLQLQNLKAQLDASSGKKKGKGKKGKGKKKGKAKGKGKAKKGKALPGEKLCSAMSVEEMLSNMVELSIVNDFRPIELASLVGDFNFVGSLYHEHADVKDRFGNWVPQNPSIPQVRQALIEYVLLPLGSPFARIKAPFAKSVLLYGPPGCGKTMMAQAVAHHTNALFINMSPGNLEGKAAEGKSGPTKLVHMAFKVARHEDFAPAVIYFDQAERFFAGKKKGAGSDQAGKFKKDMVTYINSLQPEERVAVIGCTNKPYDIPESEFKDLKQVFDKFLHVPWPDYSSRVTLWKNELEKAFDQFELDVPQNLDVSSLALVTEGYSPEAIAKTVNQVVTRRRLRLRGKVSLDVKEFLAHLSSDQGVTLQEIAEKINDFTAAITGLRERRALVKSFAESGGDGKKEDGKKKKKK